MKRILSNLKKEAMIMAFGAVLAAGSVLGMGCEQPADNNGNGGNENENPSNPGNGDNTDNEETKYGTPYDKEIGNGIVLHNFVSDDDNIEQATVVDDMNHYLGLAETYINDKVTAFEESLKGRPEAQEYFADLIKNMKNNDNFHMSAANNNEARHIDFAANNISDACSPVMCDIVKNLDNRTEGQTMYFIYRIMANEAYYLGLGGARKGIATSYNNEKDDIIDAGQYNEFFLEKNFDLNEMYNTKNFDQITQFSDGFYQKAAAKMGNQITKDDLVNVTNMALLPWSFMGMDVLTHGITNHTNCLMNQLNNGITNDMAKAYRTNTYMTQQDLGLSR